MPFPRDTSFQVTTRLGGWLLETLFPYACRELEGMSNLDSHRRRRKTSLSVERLKSRPVVLRAEIVFGAISVDHSTFQG